MESRRNFLKKSAVAAAVTGTVLPSAETRMPFLHHVFFWLKNPASKADHDRLLAALQGLRKIPVIRQAHIGRPVVTEFDKAVTDGSYTFSVLLAFDNAADEQAYLVHPLHRKFIDDNKDLWTRVVVYDSELI